MVILKDCWKTHLNLAYQDNSYSWKLVVENLLRLYWVRKPNGLSLNWNGKVATVVWVFSPSFLLVCWPCSSLIKKGSDWISFVDPLYQSSRTELLLFVIDKLFHNSLLYKNNSGFRVSWISNCCSFFPESQMLTFVQFSCT